MPLAEVGTRLIDALDGVAYAVAAGQPAHTLAQVIAAAHWTRDALPRASVTDYISMRRSSRRY